MTVRLRILMAEDEALAAEVLQEGLQEFGFAVLPAEDGQAALDLAASGAAFDVLLTDLRMPRLDGQALIRALRRIRPDLPVVVMTGYPPPGGEGAMPPGPAPLRLLTKPIHLEALVDALHAVADAA